MASTRQIAANRANARKSTGPRSAAGKAAAARNALKHGLFARHALAAGEDAAGFDALRERIRGELAPIGVVEEALCARIVGAVWRLERIVRMESDLVGGADPSAPGSMLTRGWLRYDEIDRLRLFSQYEARLDRMLHRALHELQRLQAARRGADVPPPLALDIDVAGLPQCLGGAEIEAAPGAPAPAAPSPTSVPDDPAALAVGSRRGAVRADSYELARRLQPIVLRALSTLGADPEAPGHRRDAAGARHGPGRGPPP